MCYCCSWDSPGSAVDLISESIGYLCALRFLGGLAVAGFRASHGKRGPVFYCHIMTTVFSCVREWPWQLCQPRCIFWAFFRGLENGISANFRKSNLNNGLKWTYLSWRCSSLAKKENCFYIFSIYGSVRLCECVSAQSSKINELTKRKHLGSSYVFGIESSAINKGLENFILLVQKQPKFFFVKLIL